MSEDTAESILRRLSDLEEIRTLKARYFRLLDGKNWSQWANLFTVDAVLEIPEISIVIAGRDNIVRGVQKSLQSAQTVHQGHTSEITFTNSDAAHGIFSMFDYIEWPDRGDGHRNGITGYGHYHEDYVRAGKQGWRIARSRLERIRIDGLGEDPPRYLERAGIPPAT